MLDQLEDWIRAKWTDDSTKWNSYAADKKGIKRVDVTGSITEKGIYSWIRLNCEGGFDITTPMDELSSWLNILEEYSWVGETATIPDDLTQDTLNSWAVQSTHYLRQEQKDDTNHNYLHEGRLLFALDDKGNLKSKTASGVKYSWTDEGADPEWDFEEESSLIAPDQ